MQRAARSSLEVRAIEKDAGVLDEARHDVAVALHSRGAVLTLGLELPLIGGEALGGALDAPLVLFVHEVGPVAAASLHQLGGGPGEHALTAVAEDAGPVTFEECHVEHPGALTLEVFETDPLVRVGGD